MVYLAESANIPVITLSLEYITPDLARYYLSSLHEQNRELDWTKVEGITDEIRSGEWKLNNHLIAFDPEGKLVDGQHRLHAIAKAGLAVEIGVMRGLPWHSS